MSYWDRNGAPRPPSEAPSAQAPPPVATKARPRKVRRPRRRRSWALFVVLPVLALVVGGVAGWVEFHFTDAAASACPDLRTMVSQVGDQLASGRLAQAEKSARRWAAKLGPEMRASKDLDVSSSSFMLEAVTAGLTGPDGRPYTRRQFDGLMSGMIDACRTY